MTSYFIIHWLLVRDICRIWWPISARKGYNGTLSSNKIRVRTRNHKFNRNTKTEGRGWAKLPQSLSNRIPADRTTGRWYIVQHCYLNSLCSFLKLLSLPYFSHLFTFVKTGPYQNGIFKTRNQSITRVPGGTRTLQPRRRPFIYIMKYAQWQNIVQVTRHD